MRSHRNYFKIKIIINYFQLFLALQFICVYTTSSIISQKSSQNNKIQLSNDLNSSDLAPVVECQNTTYTSVNTRCELSFMYCANVATYQGCFKKQCVRYIRGSDCALQLNIILQQKKCYKYCCGIAKGKFDQQVCNDYNKNLDKVQSTQQGALIAVLSVSAAVLLSVIAFFIIKKQKCCQKNQPIRLMRYNVKWRTDIWEDRKCQICKTHGAMLITPCNHSFHASCFQQNSTQKHLPTCPSCQKILQDRIKIFCFSCRAKSFKIKLWKIDMLSDIMAEGKALHDDICPREVKTPSNNDLLSQQGP